MNADHRISVILGKNPVFLHAFAVKDLDLKSAVNPRKSVAKKFTH
jgi:hypothetical protein